TVVGGTVVALDNVPLAGVRLGLAKPRSSPGESPEFVGSMTTTREDGSFRFLPNRAAGRYELVAVTHRGPVSLLGEGQLLDFNLDQPLTNLTLHLAPFNKGRWRSFGVAQGLPNPNILCLLPATNGALWVGTPDGAAHFDGKEFTLWNAPASLQRATVYALRQDQRGVIWACTSMGLARFDGKEWTLRY